MDVPARLKWRREKDRFAAYPTATEPDQRYAALWLYRAGAAGNSNHFEKWESWAWIVKWEGWFVESGHAPSKQAAADQATEAWWKHVQTDIPRNIDLEAAMIAARALVRPPPNSLFAEDTDYLRKVLWHLHRSYGEEIAQGLPAVRNLYDQISAELFRRRESGETPEPPVLGPAMVGTYRRRRRHR